MSLHRYLAPPPLALAVHPAPAFKSREDRKREEDLREKAKLKAKVGPESAGEPACGKHNEPKVEVNVEDVEKSVKNKANANEPELKNKIEQGAADTGNGDPVSTTVKQSPVENAPKMEEQAKDGSNDRNQDSKSDPKPQAEKPESAKTDAEPVDTLRLLAPVPLRPVRARLDLDPSRPYPPIYTDPRGAYHKYARAVGQTNDVYIDVTKDGWLAPQWKERTERDALDRLTGEAERKRMREVEMAMQTLGNKVVPSGAGEMMLELWNALVEAPSNELPVDDFWARYDWSAPDAERHLQLAPAEAKARLTRAIPEADDQDNINADSQQTVGNGGVNSAHKGNLMNDKDRHVDRSKDEASEAKAAPDSVQTKSGQEKDKETKMAAKAKFVPTPTYKYPIDTEWTREGFEEVLATVGVQCGYNTARPLSSSGYSPPSGLILLTHGHFLLRPDMYVQFKPEGTTDKFEALVTTANDRVFGDMVKAQLAEEKRMKEREYRKRREKEKREAREKEDRERKAGNGEGEQKETERPKQKAEDSNKVVDKKPEQKLDDDATTKVAKVGKDGRQVIGVRLVDKNSPGPAIDAINAEKRLKGEVEDTDQGKNKTVAVAVVAVPAENSPDAANKELHQMTPAEKDAQHDNEPAIVPPQAEAVKIHHDKVPTNQGADGNVKPAEEKIKQDAPDGDKQGIPKGDKPSPAPNPQKRKPHDAIRDIELFAKMLGPEAANIPMAELQAAFAAMEAAQAMDKARAKAEPKKDEPVIWMWSEKVERWRWKNYADGCAVMQEGCWEERDWTVFADEWGCEKYEGEQEKEEWNDRDIHDWSC